MTATRDVTVRMKIEAQGTGSKALDELASKADKAAQAEARLGKAGADLARSQEQASTGVNRLNTSLTEQAKRQQEVRTAIDRAIESSRRQSEMDRALAKDKQYLTAMIEAENAALAKQQALAGARQAASGGVATAGQRPQGRAGSGMGSIAEAGLIINTIRDAGRISEDFADLATIIKAMYARGGSATYGGTFRPDETGRDVYSNAQGKGLVGSLLKTIQDGIGRMGGELFYDTGDETRKMELQLHQQRQAAQLGLAREEEMEGRIGFNAPYEARRQSLEEIKERTELASRDKLRADSVKFAEEFDRGHTIDRLKNAQVELAPKLFEDAAGKKRYREQDAQLLEMNRRGGESLVGPDREVARAKQEQAFAARELVELEAKLSDWRRKDNATYAEGKMLSDQLNANTQRRIQAEQNVANAIKQQGQAQSENIRQYKDFAAAQERHYESIAAAERDRLRGQQEQFGGLNAFDRHFTRQVLEKMRDQGVESLLPEEMQVAQQFAPTKTKDYFREIAVKEGFPQLQEQLGEAEKLGQAEKAEKFYAEVKVQLESEIKATIDNSSSVIEKLQNELVPKIMEAITKQDQMLKDLEKKFNRRNQMGQTLAN